MDGYTILAGLLIFILLFIYLTWFGFSVKIDNDQNESSEIKMNPYDNLPLHRKLIDKKNNKVGIFDLGKPYFNYRIYIDSSICGFKRWLKVTVDILNKNYFI